MHDISGFFLSEPSVVVQVQRYPGRLRPPAGPDQTALSAPVRFAQGHVPRWGELVAVSVPSGCACNFCFLLFCLECLLVPVCFVFVFFFRFLLAA